MSTFDFLKEHPYFSRLEELVEQNCFYYAYEENGRKYSAGILVPKTIDIDLKWYMRYHDEFFYDRYRDLYETPLWFQSLYTETAKKVNNRNRLRRIFK